MVNIIVAVGNYVSNKGFPIGAKGSIPWHNKNDLKWFKDMTTGHPIIMGRKTFDAIGHPLKNRTNIIVTSSKEYGLKYDVKVASDLEEAISYAKSIDDEIYIIGGAAIFNYALSNNLVNRVYIDVLAEEVPDADTFFPDIITDDTWEEIGRPIEIENRKAYALTYVKCTGKNNHVDEQYLKLVNDIIEHGEIKDTRAGKTRSLFGKQLRFNLKEGLPILTTKKMFTKGIIHELLWFLKGDTNIKYLVDNNVHIWDDDAYRYYLELHGNYEDYDSEYAETGPMSKDEFIDTVKKGTSIHIPFKEDLGVLWKKYTFGDLGPVYGKQWTNWDGHNQIQELIEKLKTNPDDRRLIVSAWNVGDLHKMALPPCHYTMQFYTKKMTLDERLAWAKEHNINTEIGENIELLDEWGIPSRKLSCMFHMRSNDICCGAPFNWMSYSVLTHMIAQCANMDVDELIFNGGDVHIYENQIDIYEKEQKNRNPHMYGLPKLLINKDKTNINDITFDDIKIVNYESYPSIKYPLSTGLK